MLLNIVTKAGYYSDLNEIYTRKDKRKKIHDMDSQEIMADLENIITIQEDRITENEGNQVYKLARRRQPNTKNSQSYPTPSTQSFLEQRLEKALSKIEEIENMTRANKQTNKHARDQEPKKQGIPISM